MKKFFIIFLSIMYTSLMPCFAFSELYYIKNVRAEQLGLFVESKSKEQNLNMIKTNPYYFVSNTNPEDSAIIIIQQSGNDAYYYYKSGNNKRFNTNILKGIKAQNISYEVSQNANTLGIYDRIAQDILSNAFESRYSFEDVNIKPAITTTTTTYNNVAKNTTLYGSVIQVASGEKFGVYLNNPVNTATASAGETVTAVLTADWTYNGYTIAPQGSLVYGTITQARAARYGSRNGRVIIDFNKLVTPDGMTFNISTDKIDFSVTNDGKFNTSIQKTVTNAAVGAIAGLLLAAIFGGDHASIGKAAAIGAGVGAGSAVIGIAAEMGVDAEIPSFTELELVLTKPFTISKNYSYGEQ